MAQHQRRYGTMAHVKERKRILERMIAEMPENQTGSTFMCRKCLKIFNRDNAHEIPQLNQKEFDYASGVCFDCAEVENSGTMGKAF